MADNEHWFGSSLYEWRVADTRDEVIERMKATKKASGYTGRKKMTIMVCRVPLPKEAPYHISCYTPQVAGISDFEILDI